MLASLGVPTRDGEFVAVASAVALSLAVALGVAVGVSSNVTGIVAFTVIVLDSLGVAVEVPSASCDDEAEILHVAVALSVAVGDSDISALIAWDAASKEAVALSVWEASAVYVGFIRSHSTLNDIGSAISTSCSPQHSCTPPPAPSVVKQV